MRGSRPAARGAIERVEHRDDADEGRDELGAGEWACPVAGVVAVKEGREEGDWSSERVRSGCCTWFHSRFNECRRTDVDRVGRAADGLHRGRRDQALEFFRLAREACATSYSALKDPSAWRSTHSPVTNPLCMNKNRPKLNGWQLASILSPPCTRIWRQQAVTDHARTVTRTALTWPKTIGLSFPLQSLLTSPSCQAGCTSEWYVSGWKKLVRRPSCFCASYSRLMSRLCAGGSGYQPMPKPSRFESAFGPERFEGSL